MNIHEMLPGFPETGEILPGLTDARELLASQQDGLAEIARALIVADEFRKRGCPWSYIRRLIRDLVPPVKTTRPASPSPTSAPGNDGDEIGFLISHMEPGKTYGIGDFLALLPPDSSIFEIETKRGRESSMGSLLTKACRAGTIRKIKARHGLYALPKSSRVA